MRIMDARKLIAEDRSMDRFICGFHLALGMTSEWNCYEQNRHPLSANEAEADACSALSQQETE